MNLKKKTCKSQDLFLFLHSMLFQHYQTKSGANAHDLCQIDITYSEKMVMGIGQRHIQHWVKLVQLLLEGPRKLDMGIISNDTSNQLLIVQHFSQISTLVQSKAKIFLRKPISASVSKLASAHPNKTKNRADVMKLFFGEDIFKVFKKNINTHGIKHR